MEDIFEEWFEVARECAQCGEHFLPDHRYTTLCWNCRHPEKCERLQDQTDGMCPDCLRDHYEGRNV